jgi:hypothetical protein
MKLYLSGPMSGYPDYNRAAFEEAAGTLRSLGHEVVSPAEEDHGIPDGEWGHYLARDVAILLTRGLDTIVLLPGWEDSKGAQVELAVAQVLGFAVYEWTGVLLPYAPVMPDEPMPAGDPRFHALLKEIGDLHDRKQHDYGVATDPFANVRGSKDWGVEPWVGAMVRANDKMKRLQKYARDGELSNESAHDSFLDGAVYFLIGDVLHSESQES